MKELVKITIENEDGDYIEGQWETFLTKEEIEGLKKMIIAWYKENK